MCECARLCINRTHIEFDVKCNAAEMMACIHVTSVIKTDFGIIVQPTPQRIFTTLSSLDRSNR